MSNSNTPELPEDHLPQEVVDALRQSNGPPANIPESLNEAILADAQTHLSRISRRAAPAPKPHRLRWVAWSTGTLAAALLLFALLPETPEAEWPLVGASSDTAPTLQRETAVASTTTDFHTRDIDGNGQINILDAFALARTMNSGDINGVRWDQNDDGQLNQADVKLVALTAVTL